MRIRELKLGSSDLLAQYHFYVDIMGFKMIEKTAGQFTVQVGQSLLTFEESNVFNPYHFAFNIPSNKIEEACQWLKNRVELLPYGDSEIQPFESWNAEAIYFYDNNQNIGELIARKNLDNHSNQEFNVGSILEISEIGIPCNSIEPIYDQIKNLFGLEKYSGDLDRFCAIGTETGLFICIDKNKKTWFPTGEQADEANFEIHIESKGNSYHVCFDRGKFIIPDLR